MENKRFSMPFKTKSFEGNRKFSKCEKLPIFHLLNSGRIQNECN
ncbi:MAG: hypothetical protein WC584_00910 [Candidatus Pacearchaeota archaeon]